MEKLNDAAVIACFGPVTAANAEKVLELRLPHFPFFEDHAHPFHSIFNMTLSNARTQLGLRVSIVSKDFSSFAGFAAAIGEYVSERGK